MFPLTIRRVIGNDYVDFTWDEPDPETGISTPTDEWRSEEEEEEEEDDTQSMEEESLEDSEDEDSRTALRGSRKKSRV